MMKERELMMEERTKVMKEHKELSEEKRREIEVRVKKAREEHKLMRVEHEKEREEYQKQRKIIIKERLKLHDSLKDKHGNIFIEKHDGHDEDNLFFSGKDKVLFIVDGEESDSGDLRLRHPEAMNVLKGEQAVRVYGDKGKDGVVIVTMKPHGENNFVYEFEHEMDEPNVELIVDPNMELEWISEGHNATVNMIKKSTTDAELKGLKSNLKEQNIVFKYSKLKRNKNGEITSIKIALSDEKGKKSSATWKDNEKGIPRIMVGKIGDRLITSSSY